MRCVLRFQFILRLLRGGVAVAMFAVSLAAFGDDFPTYADRPDVLQITPQTHASLSRGESNWIAMRRAHVEAVAQMLELYPNQDLYFLARDSELLYDAARLIARNDPALLRRLHLLNISRVSVRSSRLMEYLAQEGITPESLRSGHRPVFVDTGFKGTIPAVIAERFPEELRPALQTHLICSGNAAHPSSRVFLQELSPSARNTDPVAMHNTLWSYERLPRFTHQSDGFVQINGRWQALSPVAVSIRAESDSVVSQNVARQYQADLAHYVESREGRELIQRRRRQWRRWRSLLASGRSNELQRSLRSTASSGAWGESAVRDFVQWSQTNGTRVAAPDSAPLVSAQLGLRQEIRYAESMSNNNVLTAFYPQWATVFENPPTQIAHLLDHGGIAQLGAMLDVIQDSEFKRIAATQLGERLERPEVRQLLLALIEQRDPHMMRFILKHVISAQYQSPHIHGLIQAVIDTGDQELLSQVATVFSEQRLPSRPDLMRNLIQHGNQDVLNLLPSVLVKEEWIHHPDLLRLVIDRGNNRVLTGVALYLGHPDILNRGELYRLVIEKGGQSVLRRLAGSHILRRPHDPVEIGAMRMVIDRADEAILIEVAQGHFLSSEIPEHSPLIARLRERGSARVLEALAQNSRVRSGQGSCATQAMQHAVQAARAEVGH